MTVPLKGSRANKYAHAPLCHEREYRTVCGVCAYGARVVHHFLIEGIHLHRNLLLHSDVHWNVPGWYECSIQIRPCKQVCARTFVSWACLAHGLQCLRVRGACCPSLLKQLVIWVVVEVPTVTVICCYNSMCTGMYRVGMNVPLNTNRANKYAHVPLSHGRVRRTVCSVCAYGARVVHHFS